MAIRLADQENTNNITQSNMRNLLAIGLLVLSLLKLQAQALENSFLNNLPQDSLMFMLYFDQERLGNDSLLNTLKEELSGGLEDLLPHCQELCFYAQNQELYHCYTVRFRIKDQIPQEKVQAILEQMNLKVTGFTSRSLMLDGGANRYAFLYNDDHSSTLKIYSQNNLVNKALREQHQQLYSKLWDHDEQETNSIVENQLDSLVRLDSLNSKAYFDDLLRAHQLQIDKGESIVDIQSPLKYDAHQKEVVANKALVLYVNPQMIEGIPYHLINAFNYDSYNHIDWFEKLGMSFTMHDRVWLGASVEQDQLCIEALFQNDKTRQQYYKKLDKDLLKYLPATAPESYWMYNMDMGVLKEHLLKNFSFYDMDDQVRALIKLALIAIDDDVFRVVGNGFICISGESKGNDVPDFKLAFKMPNAHKGQQLMDVLCDDLNLFKRRSDNTFISKKSDKPIYLCMEQDVWILGTAPFDTLKQQNHLKDIHQYYPLLTDKTLVQYININEGTFASKELPFNSIELTTKRLNKKSVKTTIRVNRNQTRN